MHFPVPLSDHLLALAAQVRLVPEDVEERFVRGGGHGGQKINKTASCVELKHRPTGITVRMQHQREQHRNREEAWALLIEKLVEQKEAVVQDERHEQFLKERRRRPRPRRIREGILQEKKYRGDLKKGRRPFL